MITTPSVAAPIWGDNWNGRDWPRLDSRRNGGIASSDMASGNAGHLGDSCLSPCRVTSPCVCDTRMEVKGKE